MINYIRIAPYNAKVGALCRRLTVGGMLFEEDRWYELPPVVAGKLRKLVQDSGAPYFQIVETESEWREITRRELAAAMVGPAGAALADLFQPQQIAPSPLPKEEGKSIPSAFGKIAAKEVEPAAVTRAAAADLTIKGIVTSATVNPERASPVIDIESLTREELLALCSAKGISIDGRSKKVALIAALKKQV